jgi:hypothetical protein
MSITNGLCKFGEGIKTRSTIAACSRIRRRYIRTRVRAYQTFAEAPASSCISPLETKYCDIM